MSSNTSAPAALAAVALAAVPAAVAPLAAAPASASALASAVSYLFSLYNRFSDRN
jgi:hypothetical protein